MPPKWNELSGLGIALAILVGCGGDFTGPGSVEGSFTLSTLNESSLPYDQNGLGCCIYLGGSLDFQGHGYTIGISARNRNNGLEFTAVERGTFVLRGTAVTFTRTEFEIAPLLLDVGTVARDGSELRVKFGDEGPGSPLQFRAVFIRSP